MAIIRRIWELVDEQHEVMAWLLFIVACIALFTNVALDWPHVALFVTALVTMRSLRAASAGPAGVKFEGTGEQ